ncbi:MAG: serine/threonine-protein phosphatase [Acidimicrobiia bacterium]|nr:serine/threonine-protein phosphatase [Acidimicrobiia bacterium]
MADRPLLAVLALAALLAAWVWGRSARRLRWVAARVVSTTGQGSEPAELASAAVRKDAHTSLLYAVTALGLGSVAVFGSGARWAWLLLLVPVGLSLRDAATFQRLARVSDSRAQLEQRAEHVLSQEDLAPKLWAARLAPEQTPDFPGFELGSLYQAGTGMMAGDFYDVFRTSPTRLAAVIGDVTGHGIEPSITAFQAKYLLRVFLRQFRDPAQALEELNTQMSGLGRTEEFISMCVVVLDTEMGTLRYASAGHPAAFLRQEGEVRSLEATGPLVCLDAGSSFASRELPLDAGDLVLLYTDGLAEARAGGALFGEDRIAAHLRRDPAMEPEVLCKSLVEAAQDYANVPISDDIAILAIRRA